MKKLLFVLAIGFFSFTGFSQEISVIEPQKYHQDISSDEVQLIDIRTPKEFKDGHIKGAKNIDFLADDFMYHFEKLDKSEPVYIYCRSGNRSSKASAKLAKAGFTEIIDLKGGYKAWTGYKEK